MWQLKVPDDQHDKRLEKVKGEAVEEAPYPYRATTGGLLSLVIIIACVAGVAGYISHEWWVCSRSSPAGALAVMNFRIAEGTGNRFTTFAVMVFFSLPLFGAVVSLLILADEPLVQPAALIRSVGDGRTVVQGLYISESDSHVFLGTVATEGCGYSKLLRGSGSIYSIPKSEILEMRVGRGQTVAEAVRSAPALARLLVRNAGAFPDRRTPAEKKAANPRTTPKPFWPLRYTRDLAVRQEPEIKEVKPPCPEARRPRQRDRRTLRNQGGQGPHRRAERQGRDLGRHADQGHRP